MSEQNTQIKVIEYEFNGNKYKEEFYSNPKLPDGSLNPNYMSSKAIYKQETVLSSPIEGDFKKFVELTKDTKDYNSIVNALPSSEERIKALGELYTDQYKGNEEAFQRVGKSAFVPLEGDGGGQDLSKIPVASNEAQINVKDPIETPKVTNIAEIREQGPFDDDMVYPLDMLNLAGQDYMYFEQFSYQPPQPSLTDDIGTNVPRALTTGLGRGRNVNPESRHGTCLLPIPNRLSVSDGVNWGEGRANALEASAFGAATSNIKEVLGGKSSIADLFKGAANQAAGAFATLKEQMKNMDGNANAATVLNAVLARGVLGSIGINVDVDQFLVRQTGQAINPNLELLFGGPKLRSFSFEFNFAPNSAKEAREVRKIQRWFRQGMLAQKMSDTGTSLFLGSPHVFRLCYKNSGKRIRGLNTFKICALTSAQINFTPDGVYQSYEDNDPDFSELSARSMPVRSTMGLTFSELTPIFFNDYETFGELNDDGNISTGDTSLLDVQPNISGENKITKDDLGF